MIPTTQKALRHTRILKDGIPFSPKEFKICKCVISIRLLQVRFLSTIFLRFAIPICSLLPKIWRGECVRGRNYTIFTKYNCFLYYPWTITVLIICKKKKLRSSFFFLGAIWRRKCSGFFIFRNVFISVCIFLYLPFGYSVLKIWQKKKYFVP